MKMLVVATVAFAAMLLYCHNAYQRDMARCQAKGFSYDTCFLMLR